MWVFLSRTNCFFLNCEDWFEFIQLLCGPMSNHEGWPEYIPKRLQKNDLSYISGARVCFLILEVWTRGTFSKRRFFFFFAMRQNRIDDALMMHACAMHACWDRFSKKHRLLNFFRFPARSKSLMYYPTGNKKEIRGFVLDWWLLVITYFWIWKKINRIHYGVQLLCCSGYSPAYHSRANDCLRMPLFLLPTQNTYWVLSKFQ